MYIYTVKPGDTLFDIAQKNGVTISALVAANQLSDPYKLPVGLALVIPGQSIRERSIVVNGYAFPGISEIAPCSISPISRCFPRRPALTAPLRSLTIRRLYANAT